MLRIKSFLLCRFLPCLCAVFLLAGCGTLFIPYRPDKLKVPYSVPPDDTPLFDRIDFSQLPGYKKDNPSNILGGLLASCSVFKRIKPTVTVGSEALPLRALDWQRTCRQIEKHLKTRTQLEREFFENLFVPYRITAKKAGLSGLFTGYYEAELEASRKPHGKYRYPIYKRPKDLQQSSKNKFKPYLTRAEINSGKLAGKNLELFWAKDPLDVFILQIQGSGKIKLDDGTIIRVSYDGHNGYRYRSIAKKLIEDGFITVAESDWQGIREWLMRNPKRADAALNHNKRFVFFRISEHQRSVVGAHGTPLIAGRSLATDLRYIPLGSILWVDIENIAGERPKRIRRFMVAQDTGGAIRGVTRGDFYWGSGNQALHYAGRMKSKGHYYVLLPKIAARRISLQSAGLLDPNIIP